MKNFKLILFVFLVFYISTVLVFGDSITIEGWIITLSPCYDIDSPRFQNEYNSYNFDNNLSDSDFDVMEIILKKDDGIFDKYCIIVEGNNIFTIKSNLRNIEALRSLPSGNFLPLDYTKEILERFPKLIDAVDLQIEYLKRILPGKNEWSEPWVSYSVTEYKLYNNYNYIVIQFSDSYNSLGGILYILDYNGEIIQERMLIEDISVPVLYYCRILSEEKMILFFSKPSFYQNTEISVESIIINNNY